MFKTNPFLQTVYRGILGALIGVAAGLFLGVLIWFLNTAIVEIFQEKNYYGAPASTAAFMGMGFGAILGSIFGSISGLKEKK